MSQGYASVPELADYVELFTGAAYRERARRDGLHRWTAKGTPMHVTALVLERTPGEFQQAEPVGTPQSVPGRASPTADGNRPLGAVSEDCRPGGTRARPA